MSIPTASPCSDVLRALLVGRMSDPGVGLGMVGVRVQRYWWKETKGKGPLDLGPALLLRLGVIYRWWPQLGDSEGAGIDFQNALVEGSKAESIFRRKDQMEQCHSEQGLL